MPRTKQQRKPKQSRDSLEESDLLVKDFERQTQLRIMKIEAEAGMVIKSFETFTDVTLSRLPSAIRQMTLGDLLNQDKEDEKENYNEVSSSVNDNLLLPASSTVKGKRVSKRVTAASDDGYVTEGTTRLSRATAKVNTELQSSRRTRSSSRNSKAKLSEVSHKSVARGRAKARANESSLQADKFKTPASNNHPNLDFGLVTPKIKPNTPLNVLRRPRIGETVISMQGSPILVSGIIQDKVANLNVPLSNGNIMSLLPKDGLRMSHIPSLDPETMRQLETLKNHIEKVISLK